MQPAFQCETIPQDSSSSSSSSDLEHLRDWRSLRTLLVGMGLMFFYQFAGYNVISYYAGSILKIEGNEPHSSFSPNHPPPSEFARLWQSLDPALLSSVLVGFAGLCGVGAGVYVVQKIPRKVLLLISAVGTALSFLVLGGYILQVGEDGKSAYSTISLETHPYLVSRIIFFFLRRALLRSANFFSRLAYVFKIGISMVGRINMMFRSIDI